MTKKKNNSDHLKAYAKYSGIAFQMMAIIGLGVWGGIKLDEIVKMEFPVFTVVLSLLSVGLALYYTIKDLI